MSAYFINNDGQKVNRTRCQIFTRVMGYCRPVNNFNTGKKSEFYSRKYFSESFCSCNADFSKMYSC